jgi:hypothetical protein
MTTSDFTDSFPPAEDDHSAGAFVRGFVAGLCLAAITATSILLVMLKAPQ